MLLASPAPPLAVALSMALVVWMVLTLGVSKSHRIPEYSFPLEMDGEMDAHTLEAVLITR